MRKCGQCCVSRLGVFMAGLWLPRIVIEADDNILGVRDKKWDIRKKCDVNYDSLKNRLTHDKCILKLKIPVTL